MTLMIPEWLGRVEVGRTYKNLREFTEQVMLQEWVVNEPHQFIIDTLNFFFEVERTKSARGYKRAFTIVGIKPFTVHLLGIQKDLIEQGYVDDVKFKL